MPTEDGTVQSWDCEDIIYDLRVFPDGCEIIVSYAEIDETGEEIEKEITLASGLPELDAAIKVLVEARSRIVALPPAQQGSPTIPDEDDGEEEEEEEEEGEEDETEEEV